MNETNMCDRCEKMPGEIAVDDSIFCAGCLEYLQARAEMTNDV